MLLCRSSEPRSAERNRHRDCARRGDDDPSQARRAQERHHASLEERVRRDRNHDRAGGWTNVRRIGPHQLGHRQGDRVHVGEPGDGSSEVQARIAQVDLRGLGREGDRPEEEAEPDRLAELERVLAGARGDGLLQRWRRQSTAQISRLGTPKAAIASPIRGARSACTATTSSTTRTNITVHATRMPSARGET